MSIEAAKKSRGRPKSTGIGQAINVRLLPEPLARLDAWIEGLDEPRPARPEAIRTLVGKALTNAGE